MKKMTGLAMIAAITLSACAADPDSIAPAYVSPMLYDSYTCAQLNREAQRLSGQLAQVTNQQQQAANNDAAMTAVTLVLFWPALFAIGGGDQSGELARLRGEAQAIQQAAIQKGCG
jgi:hypothetical protein